MWTHYGATPRFLEGGAAGPHLLSLHGGSVRAQPVGVFGPDGRFLWPYAPELQRSAHEAFHNTSVAAKPAVALPGRTLFAAVHGFSFYHWLLGVVPKILLARQAGVAFDRVIVNPQHTGRDRGTFQAESLGHLRIAEADVVWLDRGSHFVCDELILPSEPCVSHQTELTPWALASLRAAFLPEKPAAPVKRLFISRAKARRRRLLNEDVVIATLAPFGFTSVALEALPLATQIELFAGAEVVAGLHGAGLAHLVFARAGAAFLEITSSPWPNPCFMNLARDLRLYYSNVPAHPAEDAETTNFATDLVVDPEALSEAARQLLPRK